MKLANLDGRATIVVTGAGASDGGMAGLDVASASGGRFGPDPQAVLQDWEAFSAWAEDLDLMNAEPIAQASLGNPVGTPRQVFAIGLNYKAHAAETGSTLPATPATFTKYPSSLAGPFDEIVIDVETADWEVELVVVIGTQADHVSEAEAWDHIAGFTVGQDISDRVLQRSGGAQFSLGKSRRGYGPMGPVLVTLDEFEDPADLSISCVLDAETVQDSRTNDLVFDIPNLLAHLSSVLTLQPGDVIFTGTPSGVGVARDPRRFLKPGQVLESTIEGIGTMRNVLIAGPGS